MSKKSLLILTAAASVCAVLSAHGQVVQPTPGVPGDYVLPEGGAKALVQENCTICHNLRNIVNSNKSQEDWQNTVNMMKVGRRSDRRRAGRADQGLPDRELPGKAAAQAGRDRRPGPGQVPAMDGADAGLAPARSAGDARRRAVVVGTVRQPPRPARSQDRRDEGISDSREGRPARADQRQGRQHLVRRQLGRPHRQARREDR